MCEFHVFPYSARRGTGAAAYPNHLDAGIKKARCRRLAALDVKKRREFYRRFVGAAACVLVELARDSGGFLKGRTRNYIPVRLAGSDDIIGCEAYVRLAGYDEKGMTADGEVIVKG